MGLLIDYLFDKQLQLLLAFLLGNDVGGLGKFAFISRNNIVSTCQQSYLLVFLNKYFWQNIIIVMLVRLMWWDITKSNFSINYFIKNYTLF